MSNNSNPDKARHFVGPDQGPNCLQRSSVDDAKRQRDNKKEYKNVKQHPCHALYSNEKLFP